MNARSKICVSPGFLHGLCAESDFQDIRSSICGASMKDYIMVREELWYILASRLWQIRES